MALAWGEAVDVVGEELVEPVGGVGAADEDLAHVGDIEDAGVGADGVVFVEDGGVLDWHVPSGEGDEACAERLVGGFEGRVLEGQIHERRVAGFRGLSIRTDGACCRRDGFFQSV